jgi:hypothetical protein
MSPIGQCPKRRCSTIAHRRAIHGYSATESSVCSRLGEHMMHRYFLNIEFFDHPVALDPDGALFGTVEAASQGGRFEFAGVAYRRHARTTLSEFPSVFHCRRFWKRSWRCERRQLIPSQLLG